VSYWHILLYHTANEDVGLQLSRLAAVERASNRNYIHSTLDSSRVYFSFNAKE